MAQWSAISLAAQSYAEQGAEQARSANWNPYGVTTSSNLPNPFDELAAPFSTNYSGTNFIMDVPSKGTPTNSDYAFFVTNRITITDVYPNSNPRVRQIRSDAVWKFYLTGQIYTNTAILLRTSDQ